MTVSPHQLDKMALAVMDLIRAARHDDRLAGSPPAPLRRKIVQAHVDDVAKEYGLNSRDLALATAEMMSHPEGVGQTRTP